MASLIPVLGLVLGPVAAILGVVGIRKRRAEPRCKGLAHALVALILGSLTTLGNAAFIILPLVLR